MEVWKSVKGYEDYQVSNLGRVKSLSRVVIYSNGVSRTYNDEILKGSINKHGYMKVRLYKDKKGKTRNVHQLVAVAFLNHTPNGMKLVVDHIDNNSLNNNTTNLQIITQRTNMSKDKKGCSSKYTGVIWDKSRGKWQAKIEVNYKTKHLGRFTNEIEAHNAYQLALMNLTKA